MKRHATPSASLLPLLRAAALGGIFSLFTSATASASPPYPGFVQKYFDLSKAPSCLLCHNSATGGYGTLNGRVGKYLDLEANITAKLSEAELDAVLDKWDDDIDSDQDDTPDLDELKAGFDPNDSASKPAGRAGGGGSAGGGDGGDDGGGDDGDGDDNSLDPEQRLTSVGCSYSVTPSGPAGLTLLAIGGLALRARARRRSHRR